MSGHDNTSEPCFEINDVRYPIPTLDTFTMDEAQTLYDYCGLSLEDFAPLHPAATDDEREEHDRAQLARVRNPGFKRALLHVSYQRGNPDMSAGRVRETVGAVNALGATVSLLGGDESEDPPGDSQTEPSPQPRSSEPTRRSDSGSPSPSGSDERDGSPAATGTTG